MVVITSEKALHKAEAGLAVNRWCNSYQTHSAIDGLTRWGTALHLAALLGFINIYPPVFAAPGQNYRFIKIPEQKHEQ